MVFGRYSVLCYIAVNLKNCINNVYFLYNYNKIVLFSPIV